MSEWKPPRLLDGVASVPAVPVATIPGSWRPGSSGERGRDQIVLGVDGRGRIALPVLNAPVLIGSSRASYPAYVTGLQLTPDLDLAPARGVARRHARISFREGECWLLDLNSPAGTYLNEQRIPAGREALLRVGDRIRLGDQQLRCLAFPAEGALDEEDHELSTLVSELWESPDTGDAGATLPESPDLLDLALHRSAEIGLL